MDCKKRFFWGGGWGGKPADSESNGLEILIGRDNFHERYLHVLKGVYRIHKRIRTQSPDTLSRFTGNFVLFTSHRFWCCIRGTDISCFDIVVPKCHYGWLARNLLPLKFCSWPPVIRIRSICMRVSCKRWRKRQRRIIFNVIGTCLSSFRRRRFRPLVAISPWLFPGRDKSEKKKYIGNLRRETWGVLSSVTEPKTTMQCQI